MSASSHRKQPVVILGVDPGTLVTGYGVIEVKGNDIRVLAVDVVRNRPDRSLPVRLKTIYDRLAEVIDEHHPDEFAIESAFYGKNAQSALKLGHARGVSILAAVNRQIPTAEYTPREVKKVVAGNGAASKQQVQFMVRSLLRLKRAPEPYDATDALAVALCHWYRQGNGLSPKKNGRPARTTRSTWERFVADHPERILQRP